MKLAKAALKTNASDFINSTEEVTHLLEQENGQIGKMLVKGKLVTLEPEGEGVIIGDLHGDLESLAHILTDSAFVEKVQKPRDVFLIFLGDYGDRGLYSAEVYHIILKLKQQFPENIILMRGNHEGPEDLIAQPHDLPAQFRQKFGDEGDAAYSCIRKLFDQLHNAVFVKNRCVLIHGGIPANARALDDLAYAHARHPAETSLEEMLWSDPEESIAGTLPSPRGAGRLFGKDVTGAFLQALKVDALIRGHEPSNEGFKLNHDGKVLTLFSRKGEPYCNEKGAYLKLDLSPTIGSAEGLLRWVRQF